MKVHSQRRGHDSAVLCIVRFSSGVSSVLLRIALHACVLASRLHTHIHTHIHNISTCPLSLSLIFNLLLLLLLPLLLFVSSHVALYNQFKKKQENAIRQYRKEEQLVLPEDLDYEKSVNMR